MADFLIATEKKTIVLPNGETEQVVYAYPNFGLAKTSSVAKSINLPSFRKLIVNIDHILSGHTKGGSRVSSLKSLFNNMSSTQIIQAIKEAYKSSAKIKTQGNKVLLQGSGGARVPCSSVKICFLWHISRYHGTCGTRLQAVLRVSM